MRYAFPQYFEAKARFLSYTVVHDVMVKHGHEVVPEIDSSVDAVMFSICDVVEFRDLIKMRERAKGKPLVVGGSFAFNFWAAKTYCDIVWVGEVFEMAECRSISELEESPHSYTGNDLPIVAQRIDWADVPIAQIAPHKCYYWGGVGCSNKCKFCFTSWTHRHQVNSKQRISAAIRAASKRKLHLMVSSNEYENAPGSKTFDMLLRGYLRVPVKANTVRCGIEFATEECRERNGKPVTDNEIYHALQKAAHENVALKLFHITGYESIDEWERYIAMIGTMGAKVEYRKMLTLGFNNMQYQNYTPLYAERRSIDPSKYIDHHKTREWYDQLRQHLRSVLVMAPSPFVHVACRMGIELSRDKEQVDWWTDKMIDPKRKLTDQSAYDALFSTGIMDTPALVMNHKTGVITINDKWS